MDIKIDTGYKTLKEIDRLDRLNNWLFYLIEPYIGQRVLEIGAGIGTFTKFLIKKRQLVVALDISREYTEIINERFKASSNLVTLCLDIQQGEIKELGKYANLDTAVCFNVLEHIRNDAQALENIHKLLAEKGRLVVLVPAFKFLFGILDINLGHYRRYNFNELKFKLLKAGFSIEHSRYIHFFGAIAWFLNSRIFKTAELPLHQLDIYDRLIPLLRPIERLTSAFMGQSLLLVCDKQPGRDKGPDSRRNWL